MFHFRVLFQSLFSHLKDYLFSEYSEGQDVCLLTCFPAESIQLKNNTDLEPFSFFYIDILIFEVGTKSKPSECLGQKKGCFLWIVPVNSKLSFQCWRGSFSAELAPPVLMNVICLYQVTMPALRVATDQNHCHAESGSTLFHSTSV